MDSPQINKNQGWLVIPLAGAVLASLILTVARLSGDTSVALAGLGLLVLCAITAAVAAVRRLDFAPLPLSAAPAPISSRSRVVSLVIALLSTGGAWLFDGENTFTVAGAICWLISIAGWYVFLIGRRSDVASQPEPGKSHPSWRTIALLAGIVLVGVWFCFRDLEAYPPDMTSDQVEDALSVYRVLQGAHPVFFPANEGREAFQFYYLALLHVVSGLPAGFTLLKLGSGMEGIAIILVAWWMGRAVVGQENPALGNLTGLIMAALIATSYWFLILSRLGLRVASMPLASALVFIFLAKAVRFNRRRDWLLTGLAIGLSQYTYTGARVLPFLAAAGCLIAILVRPVTREEKRRYAVNLLACAVLACAVFAPLAHYALDYPADYWHRTAEVLGSDLVVDPASGRVVGTASISMLTLPSAAALMFSNFGKVALMVNWQGDTSWFNGTLKGIPAFDFFSGALFAIGLGVLAARLIKRRDPADWLVLLGIAIILLSTTLSRPEDVPSFLRTSAALPLMYLVAALPLALVVQGLARIPVRSVRYSAFAVIAAAFSLGVLFNFTSYFVDAAHDYRLYTWPHHQAGQVLRSFIDRTGAPGNAFIVPTPDWWDHRAVAIEAGDPAWDNVLTTDSRYRPTEFLTKVRSNSGGAYELRPDREMMFFLNLTDTPSIATVQKMFPGGSLYGLDSFSKSATLLIYDAPAVGCDWIRQNVGKSRFCGPN